MLQLASTGQSQILNARLFATQAHGRAKQKRKYTGEPYIVHPQAVAALVSSVTNDSAMISAAWLHDVVEDTGTTIARIRQLFGQDVAALVDDLTNVSVPSDGNRAVRKQLDFDHTARASTRAKTIKLADLIHNMRSIADHDPDFAKLYMEEKRALLAVLRDGDHALYRQARAQIDAYFS
jgi:(p)ppGpp synthase/HD superfamily hydrolase